jgi:hypothetical protein
MRICVSKEKSARFEKGAKSAAPAFARFAETTRQDTSLTDLPFRNLSK